MNSIDSFKKKKKKRHAGGYQVLAKMPNIAKHQGNENQNSNEVSSHICHNDYYSKEQK